MKKTKVVCEAWSTTTIELEQLELPVDTSKWKITKDNQDWKEERKKEVETQAQTVLTLGLDQITKFIYRLDGPLGEGNI